MDKMNVIAVDVGTASVRLAIVSFQGLDAQKVIILASHKEDIPYFQDGCKFEQRSSEIWKAICVSSNKCIEKSKIKPDSIKGIAFSATCSLVIQQHDNSKEIKSSDDNDIIMWADHRAVAQAQRITDSNSNVLKQFGGVCSPEFSLSKLVWLNENDQERIHSTLGFFELPDWLVYRCTNDDFKKLNTSIPKSSCCVICKWGYNAQANHHCDIIDSLESNIYTKIGTNVMGPGTISGFMTRLVAKELGILNDENKENSLSPTDIVVATSLIDAHSGMLAMLSVPLNEYCVDVDYCQGIESTFCSLAGTSSCHMLLSKKSNYTKGIWGPYKDVILEGYYLLEAGQSMTGKLVEMCIQSHEEGKARISKGETIVDIINNLNKMIEKTTDSFTYDNQLHVLPTYHGNRSPLANSRLRGGIYGLSADKEASLLDYYIATIESLVYETKLIVETLGTKLNTILVSGGLMKNSFYMQSLADILNCKVVIMSLEDVDFMVMGSALVARHAIINNLQFGDNMQKQLPLNNGSIKGIKYDQLNLKVYQPKSYKCLYHEKRYSCYKEFVDLSLKIDKIMNTVD